jgi:ubiquinone/menaquinone biosynthesis C-methylase UbiE
MSIDMSHLDRGTDYGNQGVKAYAELGHGSDMHRFLRPFIAKDLEQLEGKAMLDAGCGACPYAIYAALCGAKVQAIDIQDGMISEAQKAVRALGLSDSITAQVGDATKMSFKDDSFDHAISINVGCNLPPDIFSSHFQEIGRTLKSTGSATIAAPYSLEVVFTNGLEDHRSVQEHIRDVLQNLPDNPSPDVIRKKLNELTEVNSATFVLKDGRLELVTPKTVLTKGQPIWRKLTHVTIPNFFHSKEEYLSAFEMAKLKIEALSAGLFSDSVERQAFNASKDVQPKLGPAYETNAPFIVYHVRKK